MTDLATNPLVIDPITVPPTLADDTAGVFRAIERIGNALCLHDAGHSDMDETAEEILPMWLDQTDYTRVGFTARRHGEIVGVALMTMANAGEDALEFDVWGEPALWGQGIEEALLAAVEAEARRRGRSIIQTYTVHRPDTPGERLAPSTGHGSIPAVDRQTRFQVENGFTLEQVERYSEFDLASPPADAEERLTAALAFAGPDYRLVEWTSPTPPEWEDEFAYVLSRLTTDMPAGGLTIEVQPWDAARVRRRDAKLAASGTTVSVAVVEHVPSGRLAAYNELGVSLGEDAPITHQFGTVVVPEHRGRRLGMIVKTANLLRIRDVAPTSPKVTTWNAEENAHMLAINVSVGFRPVSSSGAWKKVLDV